MNESREEIDTLARTIYGEARGETLEGKVAVANVILNRVLKGGWWGSSIVSVCLKKYQFSCWLESDPNRVKIEKVTSKDAVFSECLTIAKMAIDNLLVDNTKGATHYHTLNCNPAWKEELRRTVTIGNHQFYIEK